MRVFAAASVFALSFVFAVVPSGAQTSSTAHTTHRTPSRSTKPTVSTPVTPVDPKATEGLAAVGTMPAATGPSAPLFTLRYVDLKLGTGELARSSSRGAVVYYTVHYTGWLTNGTKFDSSVDRGEPFVFPVGARRVITAWDTGFEGMRVGGKRRLIVPYQLAYGAAGAPPDIPAKSDLIFDVELLGQGDTPQPVIGTAPTEAAAPSSTTGTTASKAAERPEEHQE